MKRAMIVAVTSLIVCLSPIAHAESIQEKIDGLYDAMGAVAIRPTATGCQELRRRLNQEQEQDFVEIDRVQVTRLIEALAECEPEEEN